MSTFLELKGVLLDRELGSLDTNLFTAARRGAAVNEAQREFARLTGCLTRQATIALSDNDQEKDLESVVSAGDFLMLTKDGVQLKKTVGSTVTYLSGRSFERRDIPWLDRYYDGWRSASVGTPTMYYIREDGGQLFLGLVPGLNIAGSDTWDLIVPYHAFPSDMSADADEPFTVSSNAKRVLRPYHQGIVHFAAGQLESLRKNYQGRDRQIQLFNTYVTEYLQKQRRQGGQHVLLERDYLGEVNSQRQDGITADWWMR